MSWWRAGRVRWNPFHSPLGPPPTVPWQQPPVFREPRPRQERPAGRPDEPRTGTDADVAWIRAATAPGLTVNAAIPPVFADYATVVVPDKDAGRAEDLRLLMGVLRDQTPDQPWWLGYLDTGADDVVFPDAPRVTLYSGWPYVLVKAGPEEAARWRSDLQSWRAPGPDLAFPADRSWLLSWLWDDDWRCLGGSVALIDRVLGQPGLQARRVAPYDDATPPGHAAR